MIILRTPNPDVKVNVDLQTLDLRLTQRALTLVTPPTNAAKAAEHAALLAQYNTLLDAHGITPLGQ